MFMLIVLQGKGESSFSSMSMQNRSNASPLRGKGKAASLARSPYSQGLGKLAVASDLHAQEYRALYGHDIDTPPRSTGTRDGSSTRGDSLVIACTTCCGGPPESYIHGIKEKRRGQRGREEKES